MNPWKPGTLQLARSIAAIGLTLLSCLVFLDDSWRTPAVQTGHLVLFLLVGGSSVHRYWRGGLLGLTVRQLHARRVPGNPLEIIALVAGVAALMRFSFA